MKKNFAVANLLEPEVLKVRRAEKLVKWAIGKCDRCGSTLVRDVLPHRCDPNRITYPTEVMFPTF